MPLELTRILNRTELGADAYPTRHLSVHEGNLLGHRCVRNGLSPASNRRLIFQLLS